jgi:uncharacterized protein (DUF4415 family)
MAKITFDPAKRQAALDDRGLNFEAVKLRLDHDVLAAYRKTGNGWQTRINVDLRKAARKLG